MLQSMGWQSWTCLVTEQQGRQRNCTPQLSLHLLILPWFPGARWASICLQCGRPGFDPWVGKIPWRRQWHPTPALLPGKSHGQRSLVGYSPWGRKESDTTEWFSLSFFPLGLPLTAVWKIRLSWWPRRWLCPDLLPGSRKSPGEGNGYPLQYSYSCLEDSMDRGAWWDTVHEVEKQTTKWQTLSHVVKYTQKFLIKYLKKNF